MTEGITLPLLAERIAHEREMRTLAAGYERQLRERSDEHERETRELVTRLEAVQRLQEKDRIEERLQVLNNERSRQESDRGTFATRIETDLALGALGERSAAALKELGLAVTALQAFREHDLGRQSGSQGVQAWLAPNLGSIIAIAVGLVALYLVISGQGTP